MLGHSWSNHAKHSQTGTQTFLKQRAGLDYLFFKSTDLNGRKFLQHFQVLKAYQTQKLLNSQQSHDNIHWSPRARQGKRWPGSKKALRPTKVKLERSIGTVPECNSQPPLHLLHVQMAAATSVFTFQFPKLQKGCWACPIPQSLVTHKSPFGIHRQDMLTPWLSAGPHRLRGCHQQSHEHEAQPSSKRMVKYCHPSFLQEPITAGEMKDIFGTLLAQKGWITTSEIHRS